MCCRCWQSSVSSSRSLCLTQATPTPCSIERKIELGTRRTRPQDKSPLILRKFICENQPQDRSKSGPGTNCAGIAVGCTSREAVIATTSAVTSFDRHRGGGHPPTPATPPCVRVRTRRFESVALTPVDQCRKPKRFEVGIRKPNRKGFGPSEVPGAASTACRVSGEAWTNAQR